MPPAPDFPIPDPLGFLSGTVGAGKQLVSGTAAAADAVGSIADNIIATRRWLSDRHNWVRIGWTVAGLACVAIGLRMLTERAVDPVVTKAAGLAAKVVK